MAGLELETDGEASESNENELTERIPLMDEDVGVIFEKTVKKAVADEIEPEDGSPFAEDVAKLTERQKEIYHERGDITVREYIDAFPEPPEGCSEYEKAAINAAGIKNIPGHDTVDITLPDHVDDVIFLPDDLEFYSPTVEDSDDSTDKKTLGDLSGYGPAKVDRLNEIGITSVEDYMETSVETLTAVKGISEKSLEKNDHPMNQAQSDESEGGDEGEGEEEETETAETTDGETDYLQMVIESDTESLTDLTEEKIAALR